MVFFTLQKSNWSAHHQDTSPKAERHSPGGPGPGRCRTFACQLNENKHTECFYEGPSVKPSRHNFRYKMLPLVNRSCCSCVKLSEDFFCQRLNILDHFTGKSIKQWLKEYFQTNAQKPNAKEESRIEQYSNNSPSQSGVLCFIHSAKSPSTKQSFIKLKCRGVLAISTSVRARPPPPSFFFRKLAVALGSRANA